jgi:hypothetical protein
MYAVSLLALTWFYHVRENDLKQRNQALVKMLRQMAKAPSYTTGCLKNSAHIVQEPDTLREFPAADVAELE